MQLNPNKFIKNLIKNNKKITEYIEDKAPRIVGIEAVNFFKNSFDNGGFTDSTLIKWKPVKRTDNTSKWYGFQYRARSALPTGHLRRQGCKKPYKQRKENPITNFSPAATKRTALNGYTGDLKESIHYQKTGNGKIEVRSNLEYADIHNSGGMISIFGKKNVKLPKRQFIGESKKLNQKITKIIENDIIKIIKSM